MVLPLAVVLTVGAALLLRLILGGAIGAGIEYAQAYRANRAIDRAKMGWNAASGALMLGFVPTLGVGILGFGGASEAIMVAEEVRNRALADERRREEVVEAIKDRGWHPAVSDISEWERLADEWEEIGEPGSYPDAGDVRVPWNKPVHGSRPGSDRPWNESIHRAKPRSGALDSLNEVVTGS